MTTTSMWVSWLQDTKICTEQVPVEIFKDCISVRRSTCASFSGRLFPLQNDVLRYTEEQAIEALHHRLLQYDAEADINRKKALLKLQIFEKERAKHEKN